MDQALTQEKPNKLIIRVKIDNSPISSAISPLSSSQKNESQAELYNVPRIVAACAVLILLVVGFYYFTDLEEKSVSPQSSIQASVIENLASVEIMTEPEGNLIPSAEVSKSTDLILLSEKPEIVKLEPEKILTNEELVLTETISVGIASASVVDAALSEQVVESPVIPISEFSKNITRAQFTNGINKREPVDLVEGVIPARAEGLKRIYFFTEMNELKGQTIRHQWFHEGKLKSELEFKVGGNRWRVNSSKRLNSKGVGRWQVKVVNEQDELLLSKVLDYRLP